MVEASANCAVGGSPAECPAGLRCWGWNWGADHVCYPDCASFGCAGECDGDGSCVPAVGMDCYAECGDHCGWVSDMDCAALVDCTLDCADQADCLAQCRERGAAEGLRLFDPFFACWQQHCEGLDPYVDDLNGCLLEHCRDLGATCLDSVCQDGECGWGEDRLSCPQDCVACHDQHCDPGETLASCPADCSPRPANDTCGTALGLSEGVVTAGTTHGALGDLPAGGPPDVFYFIDLPTPAALVVTVEPDDPDYAAEVQLLRGGCASLEELEEGWGGDGEVVEVQPGALAAGRYTVRVSGISAADSGGFAVSYRTGGQAPVLVSASASLRPDAHGFGIDLQWEDPDADLHHVLVEPLDTSGSPILFYDAELLPEQVVATGPSRLAGRLRYLDREPIPDLAEIRLTLVDAMGLTSPSQDIVPVAAPQLAEGDTCESYNLFGSCGPGLQCLAGEDGDWGTCQSGGSSQCPEGWPVVEIAVSPGATVGLEGTTLDGVVELWGSCGGGPQTTVYHLTLPSSGTLVAWTEALTDPDIDTVLHARTHCGVAASELGCDDDEDDGSYTSRLELAEQAAGDEIYLFVSGYHGSFGEWDGPYVLNVTVP